jgi:hypothetical protein
VPIRDGAVGNFRSQVFSRSAESVRNALYRRTMSFLKFPSIATVLAGACLFLSGRADASTITTTSVATWKTSAFITGSYSILNFYPVQQTSYNTAAGLTLTPSGSSTAFTFTGSDNGAFYLMGDSTQKTLSGSTDSGAFINIAFPSVGENAFLIGTTASASKPLTVTFSDGETFSVTSGVFGISVSHSISWLTLAAAPGSQAAVSDFWFAASALPQDAPGEGTPTPAPTPEPATILMTCAGSLLLLAGSRKWKASIPQTS